MCKDDCVYKYTCKYNFLTSFLLFVCLHGLRADHFAFYNQQGGSSLEKANSPSPSNNWLPVYVEVRPQVFSPFHVNTSPIDITFALALFRKPFLEGGVPQQDFWTLVQSLCRRQEKKCRPISYIVWQSEGQRGLQVQFTTSTQEVVTWIF